jgi:hypothetical protein
LCAFQHYSAALILMNAHPWVAIAVTRGEEQRTDSRFQIQDLRHKREAATILINRDEMTEEFERQIRKCGGAWSEWGERKSDVRCPRAEVRGPESDAGGVCGGIGRPMGATAGPMAKPLLPSPRKPWRPTWSMIGVFNSTKTPNAVRPNKAPSPSPAKSFSYTGKHGTRCWGLGIGESGLGKRYQVSGARCQGQSRGWGLGTRDSGKVGAAPPAPPSDGTAFPRRAA